MDNITQQLNANYLAVIANSVLRSKPMKYVPLA